MLILAANTLSANPDTNAALRHNIHDCLSSPQNQSATTFGDPVNDEKDIYREYALNSEENNKHIVRFYDIDHIVIRNDQHALIRIYDAKWQLIEQTTDDVDKDVRAGNYYVTCSSRIRSSYTFDQPR